MTFENIFTTLSSLLPNSELSTDVDLMLDEDEDILFRLVFSTNEAAFILLSLQVYFNKTDLRERVNALQAKVTPPVDANDIEVFVKRNNLKLLPYLKEYNNSFTDYQKLAEMYYDTRGSIIGKRFGF